MVCHGGAWVQPFWRPPTPHSLRLQESCVAMLRWSGSDVGSHSGVVVRLRRDASALPSEPLLLSPVSCRRTKLLYRPPVCTGPRRRTRASQGGVRVHRRTGRRTRGVRVCDGVAWFRVRSFAPLPCDLHGRTDVDSEFVFVTLSLSVSTDHDPFRPLSDRLGPSLTSVCALRSLRKASTDQNQRLLFSKRNHNAIQVGACERKHPEPWMSPTREQATPRMEAPVRSLRNFSRGLALSSW